MKTKRSVREQDKVKLADQLGYEYESVRERLKAVGDQREVLVKKIKAVATDIGEEEGPRTVITGSKYVVGFTTSSPSKKVNWELFQQRRPKLYARLCSLQVDERKVEEALADGTLPRALLEKYTVPVGTPVERVLVEQVGKETADEDMG